jgi:hypothetical protein
MPLTDNQPGPPNPDDRPPRGPDNAPDTPTDEPKPAPVQDPPAEPDHKPYVVRTVITDGHPQRESNHE